jgi:hypothetical protein
VFEDNTIETVIAFWGRSEGERCCLGGQPTNEGRQARVSAERLPCACDCQRCAPDVDTGAGRREGTSSRPWPSSRVKRICRGCAACRP